MARKTGHERMHTSAVISTGAHPIMQNEVYSALAVQEPPPHGPGMFEILKRDLKRPSHHKMSMRQEE